MREVDSRDVSLGEGLMRVPERLLLAQARGKVLFVCGAGVSKPAGLPLFRGLVKVVYKQLDAPVFDALEKLDQRPESDWRDCQGELVHPGKASGKNGLGGMLDIRAETGVETPAV